MSGCRRRSSRPRRAWSPWSTRSPPAATTSTASPVAPTTRRPRPWPTCPTSATSRSTRTTSTPSGPRSRVGTALPQPDYVNCAADSDPTKCSTVEYKAATRKHIQDSGETIVLNIGDQYSDLQGGYSMYTAKLPNPTYYLPSLDIAGAPAGDADLALPSEFDMAPDGSTPTTEGFKGGDYIPNIDVTRNTIRNYYGADPVTAQGEQGHLAVHLRAGRLREQVGAEAPHPVRERRGRRHQAGGRLRRRRHHAVDLRHGGRGDGLQLRPDPAEHVGPGRALPGRSEHAERRPRRRRGRLQDRRPDRSQQRPAHRDARQPGQVLLRQGPTTACSSRSTTSPSGTRTTATSRRRTSTPRSTARTASRRSTTRRRPASTSRTTWA